MPVRDDDVTQVPEPASMLLLDGASDTQGFNSPYVTFINGGHGWFS